MCRNRQRFQKWWRSSISPNYISMSETWWLRSLWAWPMLALRFPATMVSWSRKRVRASYNSGKCSNGEGGMYAPMIGVRFTLVTTSQLTKLVPWKRVNSKLHSWDWSQTPRNTPTGLRQPPLCSSASTPCRIPACCNNKTGRRSWSPSVLLGQIRRSVPPRWPARARSTGCRGCWGSQWIVLGGAASVSAVLLAQCGGGPCHGSLVGWDK